MKTTHWKQPCAVLLTIALVNTAVHGATFTVTNTLNSGAGSLRQAILDANSNPGRDTIGFNIPGAGVHTISATNALPVITDPVTIDGYTQPGSATNSLANGDNAVLLIELNGSQAGGVRGLTIATSNTTVRGLVINGFSDGIFLQSGNNNVVEGNFIGTDTTGTSATPNTASGIFIAAPDSTIGGTNPSGRNVISGNLGSGVVFRNVPSPGGHVLGNFIGVDRTGTNRLANGNTGVALDGSSGVTVGGTNVNARNIISGNGGDGIDVGNIAGSGIFGNFIGTDVTGTKAISNNLGIYLFGGSMSNIIGGATVAARNIISGNNNTGILVSGFDNEVLGNFVGVDVTGTHALPNANGGVNLSVGAPMRNHIGRLTALAGTPPGNVISGNNGVGLNFFLAQGNFAEGNIIGADATGTLALGNTLDGVEIGGSDNVVGGTNSGAGNIIAFNRIGVYIPNNAGFTNNAVLGNSIFGNFNSGIDLQVAGEAAGQSTPNDANDVDDGPNHLQNFPVLTSVANSGGFTTITGTLNSTPSRTFRVEFFANAACDASGFGEGQTFLGATNVTTSGSGTATFTVSFPTVSGSAFTATATDTNGNTSEFSACVTAPPPACSYTIALPKGYSLIANQCDHAGGNTLNAVFPMVPVGSQIIKYNAQIQSNAPPATFTNGAWSPNLTLNPGEGAYFFNPTSTFILTISGEHHTPVLPLNLESNKYYLVSRQEPLIGTFSNIVGLPPQIGDTVRRWNPVTQFLDSYATCSTLPSVNVGESIFVFRTGGPTCPPVCNPPTIVTPPTNITVSVGAAASFSVGATGTGLTYQWRKNGAPLMNGGKISGATSAALIINPVAAGDAGSYDVVVSATCGSPATSTVATLTVPPPPCFPPPAGLVSWWPGDGNANDIRDGNDGTLQNGATFTAGKVGQAFSFDGTNDFVAIPHNPNLNPTGSFSVDAWIKASPQQFSADGLFDIVDKSHGWTDGTGWVLTGNPGGTVTFGFGKGGSTGDPANFVVVLTQTSVLDDQWHYLTGVYNGSQLEIYVDGVLQNTTAFSGTPANNIREVEIGRSWNSLAGTPSRFFHGLIDEVEFFNRALSASEIQAIFTADSAGKCKLAPPPVVACSLSPALATNAVSTAHTVTATVTTNGSPAAGAAVSFSVISGPNAGQSGSGPTTANGQAGFTYSGNSTPGTDIIRAVTTISSISSTCTATVVSIAGNVAAAISCPANVTTNNTTGQCVRTLAFTPNATGNPTPTVTCRIGSTVISSPHSFAIGTTTVVCIASNVAGVVICSFTVTVNDTEPPVLFGCPTNNYILTCFRDPPGPAVVTAVDNCDGTVPVTFIQTQSKTNSSCDNVITWVWTATDHAGNSASCTQTLTIHDTNGPVISGCSNVTVVAPSGQLGATVNFAVSALDFCDGPVPVSCTPKPGYFALGETPVTCEAVDRCGNWTTCSFTVTATATTEAFRWCSFTQGFYGNANGKFNGNTSFILVGQLLGQGPLVVGKTGLRSLRILSGDAVLLQQRLPSGGTPAALPNNGNQTLQAAVLPLNPKGRFANVFLGQTITLALNVRLSPALLSFGLTPSFCSQGVLAGPDGLKSTADDELIVGDIQMFSVPASVRSALLDPAVGINDLTVLGLLELANRALAGLPTGGASLSDINAAVDAINRGFDECRALANCSTSIVVDSFNDSFTNRPALGSGAVAPLPLQALDDPTPVTPPPPAGSLNIRVRSSNLNARKEPGEPTIAGNAGGKSVWWQWRAPRTGLVKIQTTGSSFDTLLGVYTGTALANLVLVASNDDANGTVQSEVTFPAQAGTNYQITVDGVDGASGEIVLTLIVDPPRLCLPVTVVSNQVQLCIAGEIGRTYTVEASPDLSHWTLIATALNNDGTLRFTDPAMSNFRQRFYRVTFEP